MLTCLSRPGQVGEEFENSFRFRLRRWDHLSGWWKEGVKAERLEHYCGKEHGQRGWKMTIWSGMGVKSQSLKCFDALSSILYEAACLWWWYFFRDPPPIQAPNFACPCPWPVLELSLGVSLDAQPAIREWLIRSHRAETILRNPAQAFLIVVHQLVR